MKLLRKFWIVIMIALLITLFIKLPLFFLLFGLSIVFLGIEALLFIKRIKKNGIPSTGKILDFESDEDGNKSPIIEFRTLDGENITAKPYLHVSSGLQNTLSLQSLGTQHVSLLYDFNDPKKFILVNNKNTENITFLVAIGVGVIFTGVGICGFVGYIKMG